MYFTNPDCVFDLLKDGVLPHAELIVEGEPRQGQASQPSCSGIYAQQSRSSAIVMDSTPPRYSPGSQFTSVTAHRGKLPLEEATYRLKIIQATMAFAGLVTTNQRLNATDRRFSRSPSPMPTYQLY